MKTKTIVRLITVSSLLSGIAQAAPLGTAFTYQGRLAIGTNVANGNYDLKFSVYDASSIGNQVGNSLTNAATGVTNGLFAVTLDFGSGVFTGEARWLEIAVRTNGGGAFTALSPRQPITPAPYSLYAPSAGTATTAITASNAVPGSVGNAALAVGAVDSSRIADGTIVTADINSIDAGKIVGGDLQATRLNVGSAHILTGTLATIAGGTNNAATNSYATVGGGQQNTASRNCATVAGGQQNTAGGSYSFVGGGEHNNAEAGVATIGGGSGNKARGLWCAVGGGYYNTASNETATVAGGNRNFAGATSSFVGGGTNNTIEYGASFSGIAGGYQNTIQSNADISFIGGGQSNTIGVSAHAAIVVGGTNNLIQRDAWFSTISGGGGNTIQSNAYGSAISGGVFNTIRTNAQFATVPGGSSAAAASYGQLAYASGSFANPGDAQTSTYVLRNVTTTINETELFLDGSGQRLTIPAGRTWTFDILVVARSTTGQSAGYQLRGVIENVSGTTAFVGSTSQTVFGEDVPAWDTGPIADDVNDALGIRVVGSAGVTIRWVATVRTVEVTN